MPNALMKKMLEHKTKGGIQGRVASEDDLLMKESFVSTPIPILNLALSGRPRKGGLSDGLTVFAGPSKHFKTLYCLLLMKAWLDANPNGVALFYNNEFGVTKRYFQRFNIDMSRVIHLPFLTVEQATNDAIPRLESLEDGEKVFMMYDSIGASTSKKELKDVLENNDKEDMSRAKKIKALFRMLSPYLNIKKCPAVAVAHIYMSQDNFSKKILAGGQGVELMADNVFFIERVAVESKNEDTSDTKETREYKLGEGFDFFLYAHKSRFTREGRKFRVTVLWERGVLPYSGLKHLASKYGLIEKKSRGKYGIWWVLPDLNGVPEGEGKKKKEPEPLAMTRDVTKIDDDGVIEEGISENKEFWDAVFENTDFEAMLESEYIG